MSAERRAALAAGVFFLITEVAAIAGLQLYGPVLDDPGYVLGAGADGRVQLGALFEIVLAVAIIGTSERIFTTVSFDGSSGRPRLNSGPLPEGRSDGLRVCIDVATLNLPTRPGWGKNPAP